MMHIYIYMSLHIFALCRAYGNMIGFSGLRYGGFNSCALALFG